MATHDEISSTEKLLDLIRKDNTGVGLPDSLSSPRSRIRRKPRRAITVGIDFGHNDLKLVKVMQSSDQKLRLLGYTSVPIDPQIPREGTEFPHFLNATLTEFCGPSEKCELWVLMSAARVEVRHIRIPRVSKKQIANAVYWTFKKEVPFDEKENIFDFEVLGDVVGEGVPKTACTAFAAPKYEVNQLKDLFSRSGFPLTGISIVPFAIQNLLRTRWMETGEKTVGGLYVGREWSRIDIFSSGNLVFTRGIKAGMNSLTEAILEGLNESQKGKPFELGNGNNGFRPATSGIEMRVDMEQAGKVLLAMAADSPPLTESDPGYYLEQDEVFSMLRPALERLVRQIERSFEHYSLNLSSDSVTKLYLAGWIYSFNQLVDYISEQTGLPCDIFDPFAPGNPFLGNVSTSGSVSESASFAPALGMALAHNSHTPNFLFTYKDKEKQANITRTNRAIFAVFIFIIVICMGTFLWQGRVSEEKKSRIAELQQRLEQYSPRVNQDFIVQLAAKAKQKNNMFKMYSEKYLGMAIIGELSRVTPPNIRLLNITANMGQSSKDSKKAATKNVVLEGIIFGPYRTLESTLAAYLMKLERCPIFGRPSFNESSLKSYEGKEVLRFTVHMELA